MVTMESVGHLIVRERSVETAEPLGRFWGSYEED